jgi:beta-lactamase class A
MGSRLVFSALLLFGCTPRSAVQPVAPAISASAGQAPVAPNSSVALTPEARLTRLFAAPRLEAGWFAPALLAQLSLQKIEAALAQLRRTYGALEGVERQSDHFVVRLERGILRGDVRFDAEGRFAEELLFRPEPAKLDDALAAFRALPGEVSVLVTTDGVELGALAADTPRAVGSTFKLAVLAALKKQIDQQQRHWEEVLTLAPETRSLPSGVLQSWPDGAPVTLYTLAALMISLSDNTAADTLISAVGRENVEAMAPPEHRPWLTTREFFQLKSPANADVLARFRAADAAKRREILGELRARPLSPFALTQPTALDIEWFASSRELCSLMRAVQELPVMRINPGFARRADWDSIAFKGGSEPGIISATTWVTKGGRQHCVTATWNATSTVDEAAFSLTYAGLLAWLKAHG